MSEIFTTEQMREMLYAWRPPEVPVPADALSKQIQKYLRTIETGDEDAQDVAWAEVITLRKRMIAERK